MFLNLQKTKQNLTTTISHISNNNRALSPESKENIRKIKSSRDSQPPKNQLTLNAFDCSHQLHPKKADNFHPKKLGRRSEAETIKYRSNSANKAKGMKKIPTDRATQKINYDAHYREKFKPIIKQLTAELPKISPDSSQHEIVSSSSLNDRDQKYSEEIMISLAATLTQITTKFSWSQEPRLEFWLKKLLVEIGTCFRTMALSIINEKIQTVEDTALRFLTLQCEHESKLEQQSEYYRQKQAEQFRIIQKLSTLSQNSVKIFTALAPKMDLQSFIQCHILGLKERIPQGQSCSGASTHKQNNHPQIGWQPQIGQQHQQQRGSIELRGGLTTQTQTQSWEPQCRGTILRRELISI